MFSLSTLTIAFSFVASVSALAVPRATQPKNYASSRLESYDTYHTRYMALSCQTQHNTDFFSQCCHPLLATQTLADRPAECDPEADLPFCDEIGTDAPAATPVPVNAPSPVTTAKAEPATTPAPAAVHTTKAKAAPSPKATPATNSASSTVETGGVATFFYQNGVAGACGTVHSDNDLIAAIDADRYGNTGETSSLCGKKVKITNTKNQKTVTVTIADACPTCNNGNSIDLSVAAFKNIATLDEGEVPISWQFV